MRAHLALPWATLLACSGSFEGLQEPTGDLGPTDGLVDVADGREPGADGGADGGAPGGEPAPELDSLGPSVLVLGIPEGTTFSFTVLDGTFGLQMAGDDLWIDSLADPTGATHYLGGLPAGWPSSLWAPSVPQAFVNEETLALGIPPGEWTATLLAGTAGSPISLVTQRDRDAAFHGGVLDLYLHVARAGVADPDRGVTVTPANVLEEYGEGLDRFFGELQRLVRIDRGEVRVVEVDDRFAAVATQEDVEVAFGASRQGLGPGYHVLLVGGGYELDWSGVAPGAPSVQIAGDARSTVLMDVRTRDYFDFTLLHELGHVAGLYHPTDVIVDGDGVQYLHDPLEDTAECTDVTEYMGYTIPACAEESNVMASYGAMRPATLSSTQLAIFRSSAFYRPYGADRTAARAWPAHPGLGLPGPDAVGRWRCLRSR